MRVYSYVVASDSGFAPNPFDGYCTLACCKPDIRRTARVGDWIVGMTPRSRGIVYAMHVTEKMGYADFWTDSRFRSRRPTPAAGTIRERCGDNIYRPLPEGGFLQLPSGHSNPDGTEHPGMKKRDLSGRWALVSDRFAYFGEEAPDLPEPLDFMRVGRGHRCRLTPEQVAKAVSFIESLPVGKHGRPRRWAVSDDSWRKK